MQSNLTLRQLDELCTAFPRVPDFPGLTNVLATVLLNMETNAGAQMDMKDQLKALEDRLASQMVTQKEELMKEISAKEEQMKKEREEKWEKEMEENRKKMEENRKKMEENRKEMEEKWKGMEEKWKKEMEEKWKKEMEEKWNGMEEKWKKEMEEKWKKDMEKWKEEQQKTEGKLKEIVLSVENNRRLMDEKQRKMEDILKKILEQLKNCKETEDQLRSNLNEMEERMNQKIEAMENDMKAQAEKARAEDNARYNALQESTAKIVSDLQKAFDAMAQENSSLKMDQTKLNTELALLKEKDGLSTTKMDNMEPRALVPRRRESSEETLTTRRRESSEETLASQPRRGLEETLATRRSSEEILQRRKEQHRHVDLATDRKSSEFSYVTCPCCGHILSKTRLVLTMEFSDITCSACGRLLSKRRPSQEITNTPKPPSAPRKSSLVPRVYRILQSNKQETGQDTAVQKTYKAITSEKPKITPQRKAMKPATPAPTDLRRRERLFPDILPNKGRPILVTWRK